VTPMGARLMALREFNADAMPALDNGTIAAAMNAHLKRCAADCMDRPGEKKARTVTLQFAVRPVMKPDGTCDKVDTQFQLKSKLPDHVSPVYSMGLRQRGQDAILVVDEMALENVDQSTMFGDDDR